MKMHQLVIASFVMSFTLVRADPQTDFIRPNEPDHKTQFSEETKRAFKLESEADFVGWYSTDGKLNIGIGRTDKIEGVHYPVRFTLDELESFFDNQKHKGLIVVTIEKQAWTDEVLAGHLSRLREFFVARGYKRVVIEQAYGSGRGIHLEYETQKKQNKAEMATPRKPSD